LLAGARQKPWLACTINSNSINVAVCWVSAATGSSALGRPSIGPLAKLALFLVFAGCANQVGRDESGSADPSSNVPVAETTPASGALAADAYEADPQVTINEFLRKLQANGISVVTPDQAVEIASVACASLERFGLTGVENDALQSLLFRMGILPKFDSKDVAVMVRVAAETFCPELNRLYETKEQDLVEQKAELDPTTEPTEVTNPYLPQRD
jgi:hypothetical protein